MIRSFNGMTPKIAASAFVSERAYIIGDVEIGENAGVWPGTVIRADMGKIVIGADTHIEDNCTLHSGTPGVPESDLMIGSGVIVGHGAVINGRLIGDHVLIGMNATILHDATIGSYCIVGAACLVGEGMDVPDNRFVVGVPGKIKGEPTQKQRWWTEQAPSGYLKIAREYKVQGF